MFFKLLHKFNPKMVAAVIAVTASLFSNGIFAEGRKIKCTAHAVYRISPDESENTAKEKALYKAQLDAIKKAFGTFVSDDYMMIEGQSNNKDYKGYFDLKSCDVRGEWIPVEEPRVEISFDSGTNRVVRVEQKGTAIECGGDIDLDIRLLRHGLDIKKNKLGHQDIYVAGDNLYMYFSSPVDGYLMAYLIDNDNIENPQVARLLPYPSAHDSDALPIKANHPYYFFSYDKAEPELAENTREILMTCPHHDTDYNLLYIVFSREPFIRCAEQIHGEDEVPVIRMDFFTKWLSHRLSDNHDLMIEKIPITICKK